ncbi:MAG TPA: serine/threonine-protein kinase [Gemmataceae bacterium]|nr:serine/threonine-protein kinase [Gemmataceae bacterium]
MSDSHLITTSDTGLPRPALPLTVGPQGTTPARPSVAAVPSLPAVPGYESLDVLGQGGMGVVYKARDRRLPRLVALKMIRAGRYAGAEELDRFRREANAVARLQHPNIIQIYEVGEHDGLPYCALEFAGGGSLAHKSAGAPQPCRAAAELVAVLARAVHAAHGKGVIHRDLKPSNVLLTEDGTPKLADFGLAKLLGDAGGTCAGQLTQTGAGLGTPSYMAPEQANGAKDVGPPADVYALGAILYELLTGRPPFLGATRRDTLKLVLTREPAPPRKTRPDVPRDLDTICLKCLEKDPARRYATADDLAEELRRFLDDRTILARRPSLTARAVRRLRRHPARALVAVLSVLLLAVAFAGGQRTSPVPPPTVDPGPPSQPDTEGPFRELNQELAAGQSVCLLGDKGRPRWSSPWMGRPDDLMPVGAEEPLRLRAWPSARLELLPSVPLRGYRLRAEVQHRDGQSISSAVGLYFAHSTRQDGEAREHSYCCVCFADLGERAVSCSRPPHPECGTVELTLDYYREKGQLKSWWHTLGPKVEAPFLTAEYCKKVRPELVAELVAAPAVNPQGAFRGQLPLAGLLLATPPWRTLEVVVTPTGVRLFWEGADVGGLSAAQLSAPHPVFLESDPAARPEFHFTPSGGVGLLVCRGSGAFRNVTIRPID